MRLLSLSLRPFLAAGKKIVCSEETSSLFDFEWSFCAAAALSPPRGSWR